MLKKLKALLGGGKIPDVLSAEDEHTILKEGNDSQRLQLAQRKNTRPEVLYYLAEDKTPAVRREIAAHKNTPIHVAPKLASDKDDEVRTELARKISRMMPDLAQEAQSGIMDRAITVLEKLAQDQLPKIRAVIAEEIKASDIVPKTLIKQLAHDVEEIVAAPVLEYSPLLSEGDLREVIAAGTSSKALSAIARRKSLTSALSQDIADTLDIPAVSALLTNTEAAIREDTLDQIIDQAKGIESLHKPLALRPQLSFRAMKRIAGFVASALVNNMMENSDLSEDQAEGLLDAVRERLEGERVGDDEEAKLAASAQDLYERGQLTDNFILTTLEAQNREMVIQCLAVMSDVQANIVRTIIHSKSGRAVTALAWKAELKMRTAYKLQTDLALVPSAQLLHGKDGDQYPLKESELDWHLSYFTDQA